MNLKDLEFSLSRLADASVFGDTQRESLQCARDVIAGIRAANNLPPAFDITGLASLIAHKSQLPERPQAIVRLPSADDSQYDRFTVLPAGLGLADGGLPGAPVEDRRRQRRAEGPVAAGHGKEILDLGVAEAGVARQAQHREARRLGRADGRVGGGDAAFGPKNIITAVAHGHEAAVSIDRFLNREDVRQRPPPHVNLMSQKMGIHEWSYDNQVSEEARKKVPTKALEMTLSDIEANELRNEQFSQLSLEQEIVSAHFEKSKDIKDFLTATDIVVAMNNALNLRLNNIKVGKALTRLKYERIKHPKLQVYGYLIRRKID